MGKIHTPPGPEAGCRRPHYRNVQFIFSHHVDAAADPVVRGLVYILAHHGTRPQETRAINVEDLEWKGDRQIRLVQRKTGGSDRMVMPDVVADVIAPLVVGRKVGPLFVNPYTGERLSKFVAQKRFNALVESAPVPKITMYGLRASFITNALAAGVPLYDVMLAVGHTHPAQTLRYDQRRRARAGVAHTAAAERIAQVREASAGGVQ